MFTIILLARSEPRALTATLSPLVRGAVQGLVGAAYLVTTQASEELREIADAAGGRLLVAPSWPEGFARAVASSGGGAVLVIDTGIMLGQDFWPLLADMIPVLGDHPAVTQMPPKSGLAAMRNVLNRGLRAFRGVPHRDQALLLPPALAREIARHKADPWLYAYGRTLLTLPSVTMRVV